MFRDGLRTLQDSSNNSSIPVATTGAAYSEIFELSKIWKIGLELIATSVIGTDVDIVVSLQISNDGTNYQIEDGYSDIINITDEIRHFKRIENTALPVAKYGRFKFQGQNANAADVVIAGTLNLIEVK